MTIQLEFYQLALIIIAIIAGFWALAKVIGRQIDAKFEAITKHLGAQDERLTALEKQVTDLRVELARDYVHHNDYTRDIGILATKFEALAINVERLLHDMTKETMRMIEATRK
jgi:hypothetical protein